ncbi:hypothetical protein JOQ06_025936, partial [Pogonophryne albipinna]
MVVKRYEEEKTKAKAVMQRVEAVSLTADMWTSINMDAYLAVTCHYVDDSAKLATVLLGVLPFPEAHTAVNITAAMRSLMEEWGTEGKVTSIVTDAGANMVASHNSKREAQKQMNRPVLKLIQEVDTRWNSTYLMLQRLFKERQSVGAALATLKTDATVELSEEKRVSGSKIIPMTK